MSHGVEMQIRFAYTQTSAVSEYAKGIGHYPLWDEVMFTDRDSHWYTRRVKEAVRIRVPPNNINRESGIEIPERVCPWSRNTAGGWYGCGPRREELLAEQLGSKCTSHS